MHRLVAGVAVASALLALPAVTATGRANVPARTGLVLVSQFTTRYSCCPPRVTNIKRASVLLDGTVLGPGQTFSMNVALKRRTVRRGFVPAPQISGGRLVDAVGGGISQVATTLYNAAFFAGLSLIAHTPHSFYISRYPKGREATISWGGPELIFRNDWSAPLLMRLTATNNAITVRFYSMPLGRRVRTVTGTPHSYERPRTIEAVNYSLRPGDRRLVQAAGPAGFRIEYTRRVYRYAGLARDERFRVRYQPEHAVVEVGPERGGP